MPKTIYSNEEKKFLCFLKYYHEHYMEVYKIAKNNDGNTILPTDRGRNQFKMYALDDICDSCECFKSVDGDFKPKTTDAIWYKKCNDKFHIFLIEFKGDYLCKNSRKCTLIDAKDTLIQIKDDPDNKNNDLKKQLNGVINQLKGVENKYSDSMLNGLAIKPLETVTIAIPLIYNEYYNKNKHEGIDYLDINNFLKNSKIVYRVVSISEKFTPNRLRRKSKTYRCSNITPIPCTKYAEAEEDDEPIKSYESSLKSFYRRYVDAEIIQSADFIENVEFNNFINKYLKKKNG